LHFQRIRNSEADPPARGLADRLDHHLWRVPENRRPPSADVIDVFLALDIPYPAPGGSIDKEWITSHPAKRAHGRVHAARNASAGAGKKLSRSRGHRAEGSTFKLNLQRRTS